MQLVRYGRHVESCSGVLCDISQPSASRIIKRVSEAIARMKIFLYNFPGRLTLLVTQNKFDFWRICVFSNVVERIGCTHIKIQFPGGGDAEMLRNRNIFSINVQSVQARPNLEFVQAVQAERTVDIMHIRTRDTVRRKNI